MSNFFTHKMRGKSPGEIVGWIILGAIGIAALIFLFGFVVMWLWNWLMPLIFGLPILTYWQTIGLILLSKLLLGGFGGGKGHNSNHKKSHKKEHKSDFSKWKHYDDFWKEEGDEAYTNYVNRLNNDSSESEQEE